MRLNISLLLSTFAALISAAAATNDVFRRELKDSPNHHPHMNKGHTKHDRKNDLKDKWNRPEKKFGLSGPEPGNFMGYAGADNHIVLGFHPMPDEDKMHIGGNNFGPGYHGEYKDDDHVGSPGHPRQVRGSHHRRRKHHHHPHGMHSKGPEWSPSQHYSLPFTGYPPVFSSQSTHHVSAPYLPTLGENPYSDPPATRPMLGATTGAPHPPQTQGFTPIILQ